MQPQQAAYFDPNAQANKQKKMFKIILILVGALILVAIVSALLSGGDGSGNRNGTILARNAEVLRVLEAHKNKTRSGSLKNRIANITVILASDNAELAGLGAAVTPELSASVQVAGIDAALEDAAGNNRFDQTLSEFLDTTLAQGKDQIQLALNDAETEEAKTRYQQMLDNVEGLL